MKKWYATLFIHLLIVTSVFGQSTRKTKFQTFKVRGGFRVVFAGMYYDGDTISVREILKNPVLTVTRDTDLIGVKSFDVTYNWRGVQTTYHVDSDRFSNQVLAGIGEFRVDNPIWITNITCRKKKGTIKVMKSMRLEIYVPHNYIVTGYLKTTECHYISLGRSELEKYPSTIGLIITGDTLTPGTKNPPGKYIRLLGKKDLGTIVINLDSITGKDSLKHLPYLEVWGSHFPYATVFGFRLAISNSASYISETNHLTIEMVNTLSQYPPGTTVWIATLSYSGLCWPIVTRYPFTIEKFEDN